MTLLITSAQVKELTGSSKDIEDRKIVKFIEVVQIELENDMGTTGYDILLAAVVADPTLATEADLLTLRDDYIWPWMAWRSLERAGIKIWIDKSRNGTFTRYDETTRSVSTAELGAERSVDRDMAGTYKARLYKFLKDNTDTYTWYDVGTSPEYRPQSSTGGVIIRDRYRGNCYRNYPWSDYPDE